ncbi:hypothetical protein [Serratia liquefaciens]
MSSLIAVLMMLAPRR